MRSRGEATVVRGARVLTPAGLRHADLRMEGGRIVAIGGRVARRGAKTIEADDAFLVPGFLDCHVHGATGAMFEQGTDAAAAAIADFLPRTGVTGILATLAALPPEELLVAVEAIGRVASRSAGARILGIHLEGPFINPERAGAQSGRAMRPPSLREIDRLQNASGGRIRLVTLAPELPGALPFIRALRRRGVAVALGHSNAGEAEATAAFAAGARHVVHLWNAMRGLHHREVGLVGAALRDDRVSVELICDGQHVASAAIEIVLRCKPIDKVVPVSDAVAALGMREGEVDLFGMPCVLRAGAVRLRGDGRLAGSAVGLDQALRNLRAWRPAMPLQHLLRMPSAAASRVMRHARTHGVLAVNRRADAVLLDRALRVVQTWRDGRACM